MKKWTAEEKREAAIASKERWKDPAYRAKQKKGLTTHLKEMQMKLTPQQVAKKLGVSEYTVRCLRDQGKLRDVMPHEPGKRRHSKYLEKEVNEFLRQYRPNRHTRRTQEVESVTGEVAPSRNGALATLHQGHGVISRLVAMERKMDEMLIVVNRLMEVWS